MPRNKFTSEAARKAGKKSSRKGIPNKGPSLDSLRDQMSEGEPDAIKAVLQGVKRRDYKYIKLFFEYMYGKPPQSLDVTTKGDKIGPFSDWTDEQLQREYERLSDKDSDS